MKLTTDAKIGFEKFKELIAGILTSFFAVFYLIGALYIKPSPQMSIGAEFMPKIYGSILLVLGATQTYYGILEIKRYTKNNSKSNINDEEDTKNALITFALICIYVAVLETLGFIVASAIFLFIMSIVLAPIGIRHNYLKNVIYSIALPVLTYMLFKYVLYLPLPIGTLFTR